MKVDIKKSTRDDKRYMTTFTDSNSNKLKFSGDTNPDNQIDTPYLAITNMRYLDMNIFLIQT